MGRLLANSSYNAYDADTAKQMLLLMECRFLRPKKYRRMDFEENYSKMGFAKEHFCEKVFGKLTLSRSAVLDPF
jgi:hypothetical protein